MMAGTRYIPLCMTAVLPGRARSRPFPQCPPREGRVFRNSRLRFHSPARASGGGRRSYHLWRGLERTPRLALWTRILAANKRMRQIFGDQHIAHVFAIHRQVPACPPIIALLGPFGAWAAGAGDHSQIDVVAATNDLAQPCRGACCQHSFDRTACTVVEFGGVKTHQAYALAVDVDRIAVKDIDILRSDRFAAACRHAAHDEQQRDKVSAARFCDAHGHPPPRWLAQAVALPYCAGSCLSTVTWPQAQP